MKLAYPIRKRKRGTYYLVHFEVDGPAIAGVRATANLSETILRVFFTVDTDGEPDFVLTTVPPGEGRRPPFRRDRERGGRPFDRRPEPRYRTERAGGESERSDREAESSGGAGGNEKTSEATEA